MVHSLFVVTDELSSDSLLTWGCNPSPEKNSKRLCNSDCIQYAHEQPANLFHNDLWPCQRQPRMRAVDLLQPVRMVRK